MSTHEPMTAVIYMQHAPNPVPNTSMPLLMVLILKQTCQTVYTLI